MAKVIFGKSLSCPGQALLLWCPQEEGLNCSTPDRTPSASSGRVRALRSLFGILDLAMPEATLGDPVWKPTHFPLEFI